MPLKKQHQVTLQELGRRLKLSPRAVSKALNSEDSTVRVSAKTRKRVLALAKQLHYRPNRMAQTLRTGKSGMIGVLAFQAFGYFIQQRLYLARQFAEMHGFLPNIYLIPDFSLKSRNRAVNVMLDTKVDAIAIFNNLGKPQVAQLQKAGIPLVTIATPSLINAPRYFSDMQDGISILTKHLIDQGCTNIALLNIRQATSASSRDQSSRSDFQNMVTHAARGIKKISFKEHVLHVEYDGYMVKDTPHIHGLYAPGYLGMRDIIRSKQIPDALICYGDFVAHGALLACAEFGVSVPKDLLITGFGNDPLASAGLLPLTSVQQPIDELCRIAFSDLKLMTETGKIITDRCVKLPYQLIVRKSSQRDVSATYTRIIG